LHELSTIGNRLLQRVFCLLLVWLAHTSAMGQSFTERLHAVSRAVDRHLDSAASSALPLDWRKILWFHLPGDRFPDALVVLRPRRDECAALSVNPSNREPCKALILAAASRDDYRVVAEFAIRVHPVALVRSPEGVREILFTRDTGDRPSYGRYRFDGQSFARVDGDVSSDAMKGLQVLLADDRNMPLWNDQLYAAQHFQNDGVKLSPYRIHFDSTTISESRMAGYRRRLALYDESFVPFSRTVVDSLTADGQALAKAVAWPQTLELRIWSCVDWMVERRFWEVEDRRLGRLGACLEPAVFARQRGLVKRGQEGTLDVIRSQLLQQVGVAWLLRVAALNGQEQGQIRESQDAEQARFLGAVAGHWISHQRKIMPLERLAEAVSVLESVAERWFKDYEFEIVNYTNPTPELRSFARGLALQMQAHQCVRRLAGVQPATAFPRHTCSAEQLERARRVVTLLNEDLKP